MTTIPTMKVESQDTLTPHIISDHSIDELPPPYCEDELSLESDSGADEDSTPDVRLSINAEQVVRGSHNLVPINTTHIAHAAKLSAMVLSVLNQGQKSDTTASVSGLRPGRKLNIHLTINCGVTVVGDRNIVGNFGITPKTTHKPAASITTTAMTSDAITGAKRITDNNDSEAVPAKRVARPHQTPSA